MNEHIETNLRVAEDIHIEINPRFKEDLAFCSYEDCPAWVQSYCIAQRSKQGKRYKQCDGPDLCGPIVGQLRKERDKMAVIIADYESKIYKEIAATSAARQIAYKLAKKLEPNLDWDHCENKEEKLALTWRKEI